MARSSSSSSLGTTRTMLVVVLAVAVFSSPAAAAALCPQLEGIVRTEARAALQREIALAAGLLRIFFHDSFPQGCDASVLLKTSGKTEQTMGPNTTLQPRALQLIEDIRAKVHAACGATVSCADITALATREAVVASGGPTYAVSLGQLDSLAPASASDVNALPSPFTASVAQLLRAFRGRGLADAADLVALSGAHTIGRAICGFFQDRTTNPGNDAFVRKLKADCDTDPNRLQQLDVVTPDAFDNGYYRALNASQGAHQGPHHGPHRQAFAKSMAKLGSVPRKPAGNVGEIRRSCFRTNAGGETLLLQSAAAEGQAAASA
ncbi:hypothetical protein HU200_006765 [Digitaria exilis]|uniref:Peroxidase n=1 Tax=Digitaria exilis TaxID=1010633 RepID=A0A835FRY8_9POAL|nr:hypothetical protein HU200_006765 [Digitaria exilis]CAB3504821.1 unnamed protein product [Digitaria exilis]CAB3504856.1 unnamed protein product [Digitaria exilis]